MTALQTLIETLTLDPIEVNLFRGHTPQDERDRDRIYGGQVIAQALMAAYQTVQGRLCHSLQAYFIRPGDPKAPVLYEVERSRDGKSFATRRVIAIQHGEQILNLAASFQIQEDGFEHQFDAPTIKGPDGLPNDRDLALADEALPEAYKSWWRRDRAIEIRRPEPRNMFKPDKREPVNRIWFRASEDVGPDPVLNQIVLTYATDMALLDTCLWPHAASWMTGVQTASLDHILWFHRPVTMADWHVYAMDSPSASGARGFNRGLIYDSAGRLVASACQEGLIRRRG
jgi:acyl-CoA thioesterase-2